MKIYVHIKTWAWMFIAALLTKPKSGNRKIHQMMNTQKNVVAPDNEMLFSNKQK